MLNRDSLQGTRRGHDRVVSAYSSRSSRRPKREPRTVFPPSMDRACIHNRDSTVRMSSQSTITHPLRSRRTANWGSATTCVPGSSGPSCCYCLLSTPPTGLLCVVERVQLGPYGNLRFKLHGRKTRPNTAKDKISCAL